MSYLRLATVDVSPLRRNRDFRLLWLGQLVSFLGSQMTFVAVPFQVYRLTGSPLAVGLIGLAELGPVLALAFLGGALADARDRRRLVLLAELGSMLLSTVLLANALAPRPLVVVVYAVAAGQAALFAIHRPSLDALLPRLVAQDELPAAGALSSLRGTLGMLLGPALGGVHISAFGLPAAYGVDVASFAVSLAALSLMRAVPPPPGAERPSLRRARSTSAGGVASRLSAVCHGPAPGMWRASRRMARPPAGSRLRTRRRRRGRT